MQYDTIQNKHLAKTLQPDRVHSPPDKSKTEEGTFVNDLNKLFDISKPDAEKHLQPN